VSRMQMQTGSRKIIQKQNAIQYGWRFCFVIYGICYLRVLCGHPRAKRADEWKGRAQACIRPENSWSGSINVDPWRGYKWMLQSSGRPGIAHAWAKMHGLQQLSGPDMHPSMQADNPQVLDVQWCSHTGGMESK